MEFQRKVPIEKIVDPSDVVLVNLNFTEDNFKKCFSKMEFTMGMDYLSWAEKEFSIPSIYTFRNGSSGRPELSDYWSVKVYNRAAHSAPESPLDGRFMEEYRKYLPGNSRTRINVPREDAFHDSSLADAVRATGRGTVMLTGFFTEVDVNITAMSGLMNDFFSVVISDATSTYSERVFFQSLDMISQVVEVIDTRDLEKIWGKDE